MPLLALRELEWAHGHCLGQAEETGEGART